MSADDDLRINTLHRFAKSSPRLVLREYSHCEVPAGCGGVVLRWIDPRLGLSVFVSAVSANATSDVWLDGAPVPSGTASLRSGRHVLAIHARRAPGASPGRLLLLPTIRTDVTADAAEVLAGRSRASFTTSRPAEAFSAVDFDDSGWQPARHATDSEVELAPRWARRRFELMSASGPFAFDDETWIRIRFDLDVAQWQGRGGGDSR